MTLCDYYCYFQQVSRLFSHNHNRSLQDYVEFMLVSSSMFQ